MENQNQNPENQNQETCSDCGQSFDSDTMTTAHNGARICESCMENYSYCEESEEYFPADEIVRAFRINRNTGGRLEVFVHENSDNFVRCDDGEFWAEQDTMTAHNRRGREITISHDQYYEAGDFFTCDSCGEIHHVDNLYNEDDQSLCNNCFSENYSSCDDCGENYRIEDGRQCDCDSCDDRVQAPRRVNSDLIESYSFKPVPVFKGKNSPKNPFIGFESEIEATRETRARLAQIVREYFGPNELYMKEDGSLTNGLEIVSHPMTLKAHRKNDYSKLFKALVAAGARSHDTKTCGLHFHLDKRGMTEIHKVRYGAFFSLSQKKMEVLARRSNSRYAAFKRIIPGLSKSYVKNDSRYEAVNWENSATVEVRIFKGTLKIETFLASMELVHAVYVFTRMKESIPSDDFDPENAWNRFLKFLGTKSKTYRNLVQYIEEKRAALDSTRPATAPQNDFNDSETVSA
jgi:hypothetical protein